MDSGNIIVSFMLISFPHFPFFNAKSKSDLIKLVKLKYISSLVHLNMFFMTLEQNLAWNVHIDSWWLSEGSMYRLLLIS